MLRLEISHKYRLVMQKTLSWQAYSNNDRAETIEAIKNTISKNYGCIINFNMFSDLALNLSIEIEENKVQLLYHALSLVLTVSEVDLQNINLDSKKEWVIYLNISFSRGKGDLKHEIPEVPG